MSAAQTSHLPHFAQQHRRLEADFHAHLLDLVAGDFRRAVKRLQRWHSALLQHIHIEDNLLLPHVPDTARWPARLYLAEHQRIRELADEHLQRVLQAAQGPALRGRARRQAVLNLIDAAHTLRHLSKHHHEREEMALAHELPADIQAAAWSSGLEPLPTQQRADPP